MNILYKLVICLFLLVGNLNLATAQERTKPKIDFKVDDTQTASATEAKVIILSNSDKLSITDKLTGREATMEKSSIEEDIFQYSLDLFYEDCEDDFIPSQLIIRTSDGIETTTITAYVGKVVVGTFNIHDLLVEKSESISVYPEAMKAKMTFVSSLENLTIACNGAHIFQDGLPVKVLNTNMVSEVSKNGGLTEYVIVFSLDESDKLSRFFRDKLEFEIVSETSKISLTHENLGVKEAHQYVVKSRVKVVTKEITYNELLEIAQKYSSEYATRHESEYFLAAADAYEAVRTHIDCPIHLKDTYQREQNKFTFLRKYSRYVEQAEERWKKAEESQGFEAERVWQYLNLGRQKCQELILRYPEMNWYKDKYAEFDGLYKKHPLSNVELPIISGKVTKEEDWYKAVNGTAIYATDYNCTGLDDVNKFKLKPVGAVQNGSYRIVLREPCKYLYFAGEGFSRPIECKTQTMDIILTPKDKRLF